MAKKAAKSARKTVKKAAKKVAKKVAKTAAKRTARKVAKKSARSTAKRERIDTGTDVRYAKRTASGRWSEMDDAGRSQRADRRRTARKTVRSGYGDQGDQKPATRRAAKKR